MRCKIHPGLLGALKLQYGQRVIRLVIPPQVWAAIERLLNGDNETDIRNALEILFSQDPVAWPRGVTDIFPNLLKRHSEGINSTLMALLRKFPTITFSPDLASELSHLTTDSSNLISETAKNILK